MFITNQPIKCTCLLIRVACTFYLSMILSIPSPGIGCAYVRPHQHHGLAAFFFLRPILLAPLQPVRITSKP